MGILLILSPSENKEGILEINGFFCGFHDMVTVPSPSFQGPIAPSLRLLYWSLLNLQARI